jgi:hypothetical protein
MLTSCPIPPYSLPLYLTVLHLIEHNSGEGADWVLFDIGEMFILLYSCNLQ